MFYLKHHLGGGKAALGFGPGRIGTLVSMATDSSHRVIMKKNLVATLAPPFLIRSSLFFQVTILTIKSGQCSNLGPCSPSTCIFQTVLIVPLNCLKHV